MSTYPCFHVTTRRGDVYGVAATSKAEAKVFAAARLERESSDDAVATAVKVGEWEAEFGTVLAY